MTARLRLPAKLARPRLSGVVDRARLFELLDGDRERSLVWVSGPPGSGKSTLVTTWLARERAATLWLRVDAGDADLATFFSYLAQGAMAATRKRSVKLAPLTPEYLLDLPGYARRFFRMLFESLPPRAALVLDGYEAVPEGGLDAFVEIAAAEAPPGAQVIVTSRSAVPAGLVHLEAKGALTRLPWEELRLTVEEARSIAGLRAEQAEPLWRLADGWAAGYVVLLAHARRSAVQQSMPAGAMREALFGYFVNEMFGRTDEASRQLLMRTALLPAFTQADAEALAPHSEAGRVLQGLYRQHYFIDRGAGDEPVYRYHALFREFLLAQGRDRIEPPQLREALVTAADRLAATGRGEEAAQLYTQGQAWAPAAKLLCELAPGMLAQGRNATLDRALSALPQAVIDATPWLLYWLGTARILFDPEAGRALLQAAYEQFAAAQDHTGCVLVCAGMCESYYFGWADLHPFYRWAWLLDSHARRQGPFPSMEMEIRTICALSCGFFVCKDRDELSLDRWFARAVDLSMGASDITLRMAAASAVSFPLLTQGDWKTLRRLEAVIGDTEAIEGLAPTYRILWELCICWMNHQLGASLEARSSWERAAAVAEKFGIRVFDVLIAGHGAFAAVNARDLPLASKHADRMRALLDPRRLLDVANYEHMMSLILVAQGEPGRAAEYARAAIEKTVACGSPFLHTECSIGLVSALIALGQFDEALDLTEKIIAYGDATGFRGIQHAGLLLQAGALHGLNRTSESLPLLRAAFGIGRECGLGTMFPTAPEPFLQQMFDLALVEGIERDYVRELIGKLHVPAPEHASEHWPWPVRIYCLGRFAVVCGDEELRFSTKAQAKPLELLKGVLALGGRDVSAAQVAGALWPEQDGDAALNVLGTTLYRLRRLLGHEHALTLSDGKLALDPQVCRVDAWVFERECTRFEESLNGTTDAGAISLAAQRVAARYPGAFLPADDERPFVLARRERLRSRFRRHVEVAAERLTALGGRSEAERLLRRAIEVDLLAEGLHRALMESLLVQGRGAEVVEAYERLVGLLRAELGVQPSRATQAVVERARGMS